MATRQSTRSKARPRTTAPAAPAVGQLDTSLPPSQVLVARITDLQDRLYNIMATCEIARRSVRPEYDNALFRVLHRMAVSLESAANDLDPGAVLQPEAL
jgi:hypothetical protein